MSKIKVDASWSPGTTLSSLFIKAPNSHAAELVAIMHGAIKSSNGGVIYSDDKTIVQCINRGRVPRNCRKIGKHVIKIIKAKELKLLWISRKKNKIADKAARKCLYSRLES